VKVPIALRPLGWGFWLASIILLFGFLMPLLPDFRAARPSGYSIGLVFWTGVLFSHAWKKNGRSGWAGFGFGGLAGVAAIVIVAAVHVN
jgi:hypothetical protein